MSFFLLNLLTFFFLVSCDVLTIDRQFFGENGRKSTLDNGKKALPVDVTIFTSRVAETVSDKFLSVTLDTGLIRSNWINLNFR